MQDYRIVFYDEIDDPYKVTLMFQVSLMFPALPRILDYVRANDGRYTPEFGIFAQTKEGAIAGGHLLMRISTETVEGSLDVGGVNAVGTRPDEARRGVMTAIMTRTHEYFREQGLEYSILTSSWRLGAMELYGKMDYVEVEPGWMAFKYPNQPRTAMPSGVEVRAFTERDMEAVDSVFNQVVKGSYGFVHRPACFLKARKYSGGEIKWEGLRIAQRGSEVTGYAYWDTTPLAADSPEVMALDPSSFNALLADAEQKNPETAISINCGVLSDAERGWLKDAHYQVPIKLYYNLVAKSLKGNTDGKDLRRLYGVGSGQFRIGWWDGT